jgi:hypothetical protein
MVKRLLPTTLISAIAAVALSAGPAQADPADQAGAAATERYRVLTVPMTVASGDTKDGSTQSATAEPCGVLWIGVYNLTNGGAMLDYGFQSYLGIVVHRKVSITWVNNSLGGSTNIFTDDGFMWASSFRNTTYVNSGPGTVTASNGVFIWHVNGVYCLGFVTATGHIT